MKLQWCRKEKKGGGGKLPFSGRSKCFEKFVILSLNSGLYIGPPNRPTTQLCYERCVCVGGGQTILDGPRCLRWGGGMTPPPCSDITELQYNPSRDSMQKRPYSATLPLVFCIDQESLTSSVRCKMSSVSWWRGCPFYITWCFLLWVHEQSGDGVNAAEHGGYVIYMISLFA